MVKCFFHEKNYSVKTTSYSFMWIFFIVCYHPHLEVLSTLEKDYEVIVMGIEPTLTITKIKTLRIHVLIKLFR